MRKQHKYRAKKTVVDGIVFDSKAESEYYKLHKGDKNMRMQETFILQEKFSLNGKNYRAISYRPDFTFYDEKGNLIKVVDVKGMLTAEFKLKAKLFSKCYLIPITIAKKKNGLNKFDEYEI